MYSDTLNLAIKETICFVDDLKFAITRSLKIAADFDKILICGMGASAIGGDVLIDLLAPSSKVPISVVRSMDLPYWIDSKTFVIACSYSGNTRETISMYDQAVRIGCSVAAITAGGKLMKRCEKDGTILVKLDGGRQPRNSLGLIMGYMANIIETIGGAKCKADIIALLPTLYKFRDELDLYDPDSPAIAIAKIIHGPLPVIYSTSGITASAIRWKTQINENSKMIAFNGAIPEFNHNEIVGWSQATVRFNCRPIFLYEDGIPEVMKIMVDASIETLKKFYVEPVVINIRGKTVLERCIRAIMFGDYVSLYLAHMNNADPIDVESIVNLKNTVSKKLGD